MVEARFRGEKRKRSNNSHTRAKAVVFLLMAAAVVIMAFLGKDILNIGSQNRERLYSEIVFSGEVKQEGLGISPKEDADLERIKKEFGANFKHIILNIETYETSGPKPSDPDAKLIFWLEIKTRDGRNLKPMRIKATRKDLFKDLERALQKEQDTLPIINRHEIETKKTVTDVYNN